ncbi:MAG TPA: hypothetical protein DD806_06785 [Flavobacterium sp.]|nr:hypothetical protein [Flavobacterium sp.]
MFKSIQIKKDEMQPFIDSVMCAAKTRECIMRTCKQCPKENRVLRIFLEGYFEGCDFDVTPIHVVQWSSTDRCELRDELMSVTDFISLMNKQISKYITHNFVAKSQTKYLSNRKKSLSSDEAIALLDFAENSGFKVQNSAQGFHWNKDTCTIHPVVIYWHEDGILQHQSLCILSNDMNHDVPFVHEVS